jgi:pyruvate/2-oxoglutarate dehydrogenase complex dihydrolipoamide acyltransferase (E2) component
MGNKAREINSPVIKQLLDETNPEELAKIDTEMANNKQQTAVQWFLDQLIEHRIIIVDKTTYQVKYKHEILLEQAKAMHKTEHFNTWWHSISENEPITFHQYYNETYK